MSSSIQQRSTVAIPVEAVTGPEREERSSASKQGWLTALGALSSGVVGFFCLVLFLATLGTIPVVNLFVLGTLIEIMGRVGREGRIRSAGYLVPVARRVVGAVVAVLLWLWPLTVLAKLAWDARLIAPDSSTAAIYFQVVVLLSILVTFHLTFAVAAGCRFLLFFRPVHNVRYVIGALRNGTWGSPAKAGIADFLRQLRPIYHFRLGAETILGTLAWLLIPTLMLWAMQNHLHAWSQIVALLGGLCLMAALLWLPLLQMQYAVRPSLKAYFQIAPVFQRFRRMPFRFSLAIAVIYAVSAVPFLYLVLIKSRLPAHSGIGDILFVFLITVIPAKVLLAWVWSRSHVARQRRLWWSVLWGIALLAFLGAFVQLTFYTQTVSPYGRWHLFQQSSLLLPFPFSIY